MVVYRSKVDYEGVHRLSANFKNLLHNEFFDAQVYIRQTVHGRNVVRFHQDVVHIFLFILIFIGVIISKSGSWIRILIKYCGSTSTPGPFWLYVRTNMLASNLGTNGRNRRKFDMVLSENH